MIYSNTKCKELGLLNSLHKKAIRHLTLANYNAHTDKLYKYNNLTNFTDTISTQKATFLHNYRHNRLPINFNNMFTYKQDSNIDRLHHDIGTFVTSTSKHLSKYKTDCLKEKCFTCHNK